MSEMLGTIKIIDLTPENVTQYGFYCVKDKKSAAYKAKTKWFLDNVKYGLGIKIALDASGKQVGFIEYIPAEYAWRPVKAKNFLFIHCVMIISKEHRLKKLGSLLVSECEKVAKSNNMAGICTISSDGAWMANKSLFEKNGFIDIEKSDRFNLMMKKFTAFGDNPKFFNWKKQQQKFIGWHLIYANQCPWHDKSAKDIQQTAFKHGITLNMQCIQTSEEAKNAGSGYGTFSLIKDGKLLSDHYLSKTRFENILNKID